MRIAPEVYDILPDLLRESCEVLWDPELSKELQRNTNIEDLWVGWHGRRQCWSFGVYGKCAIHETQGGILTPVEHRMMVVHQSDWVDREGMPLPLDMPRMIHCWTGLQQRTEERIQKVLENATAEAKAKKLGSARAERRYIMGQFKKQILASWESVAGYTGILKGRERKTLHFGG